MHGYGDDRPAGEQSDLQGIEVRALRGGRRRAVALACRRRRRMRSRRARARPMPALRRAGAIPGPAIQPGLIDRARALDGRGREPVQGRRSQGAQESFDRLGGRAREAAKDAAGTVMAWPGTRAITARRALRSRLRTARPTATPRPTPCAAARASRPAGSSTPRPSRSARPGSCSPAAARANAAPRFSSPARCASSCGLRHVACGPRRRAGMPVGEEPRESPHHAAGAGGRAAGR